MKIRHAYTTPRDRATKQEKAIAKRLGGRRQSNSGATAHHKGDVKAPGFLVEAKFTDKESMVLHGAVLDKIENEAALEGKEPLMELDINGRKWVVMLQSTFDAVREEN